MTWAITQKNYSQRRAYGLVRLEPKTYRYACKRPGDGEIRARLRVLAGERRRFGYRRLHILLAREGMRLNHKKLISVVFTKPFHGVTDRPTPNCDSFAQAA